MTKISGSASKGAALYHSTGAVCAERFHFINMRYIASVRAQENRQGKTDRAQRVERPEKLKKKNNRKTIPLLMVFIQLWKEGSSPILPKKGKSAVATRKKKAYKGKADVWALQHGRPPT